MQGGANVSRGVVELVLKTYVIYNVFSKVGQKKHEERGADRG